MGDSNKLFIYGLIFGAVLLFCLSLTSAFEFDNHYYYDNETQTAHIMDCDIWLFTCWNDGEELATAKLTWGDTRTGVGIDTHIGTFNITFYSNATDNDFNNLDLTDLKNGQVMTRGKQYKIKTYIQDDKYIQICNNVTLGNGTIQQECSLEEDGKIDIEKWIPLSNPNFNFINGIEYEIGIFVDTKEGDKGDWVPSLLGINIPEWSGWTSGLNTSLQSYYQLDGNDFSDYLGSYNLTNDGTVNTSGWIEGARNYSGNLDSMTRVNTGLTGTGSRSFNMWVYSNDVGDYQDFLTYGTEGGHNYFHFRQNNDAYLWLQDGTTTVTTDTVLVLKTWTMITLTFDGSTVKIYQDAVETASASFSLMDTGTVNGLFFGSYLDSAEFWAGKIDEIGIWTRAITPTEITTLYNTGTGISIDSIDSTDNAPVSELGTPINDTNLSTNSISQDFTCKGIDDINLDNLTFYLWNITSDALLTTDTNTDGQNNTLETFTYTLMGGTNYSWNCLAMDNSSQSAFATNNFTVNVIPIPDNAPNIEIGLGNPSTGAEYSTNVLVTFNASNVYDDYTISNVSVYVNKDGAGYVLNQTNSSGINNTNYIFPLIPFDEGLYLWYLSAVDNASQETTTVVRNFTIDTTAPTLTFNAPTTNTTTKIPPVNVTLNFTTTDLHLDTTTCFYNITSQVYFTCNTLVNMTFSSGGLFNISYGSNDTFNNANSSYFQHYVYIYNDSVDYTETVLEGETNIIYLYINATLINNLSSYLTYDGVNYSSTLESNNGTVAVLSNTFNIPVGQNTTENKLFNFTFNLDDVIETTDNYNQTVTFLTELNITSADCTDKALKFTLTDEVNSSNITGDIYYNFQYGTQNNSLKTAYGFINGTESFYLCINGTLNRDYIVGYGELQYTTPDHVDRRYYLFINTTLNNDSYEERDLRNLKNSLSVTFENTFEDTSLNVYPSKYMGLWRWYPGFNDYLLVEMAKTDDDGEAISHLVTEDVDYRVGLYETNGSLIKLSEPKRFICASSPCSFTLTVDADETDYTSIFDVETSLTYNATSMGFTLIYNDPNQLSSSIRLLVTREQGDNSLTICDVSSAEFSGVLTCDTSLYTTGVKKAVVYRSASPPIIVAQKLVQDGTTALNSNLGLIFSLILFLAIIFTGMVSPVWTVILAVLGLIPAFAFGSINLAIFTGVAVLGAIIIHFVKRAVAR